MKKMNLSLILIMILTFSTTISCSKIARTSKNLIKKRVGKAGRIGTKGVAIAATAVGITVVSNEELMAAFRNNANNNEPIAAEIMVDGASDVTAIVTMDGENWQPVTLPSGESTLLTSSGAGIIGIETGGEFLQIDISNDFTITEQDGTTTFY
ncbi:MAG: hypothetical protein AAF960_02425 [Bacteroidota bacterium]